MELGRLLLLSLDENTARQVRIAFSLEQMDTDAAGDVADALEAIGRGLTDLLIISDHVRNRSVEQMLLSIRSSWPNLPIIVLMKNTSAARRVRYYRLGANDIIHTPFHSDELVVRAANILKMTGNDLRIPLRVDDLLIDTVARTVMVEGEQVPLTPTEYDLLLYLVRNEGVALPRDQILADVWGYEFTGDTNLVDVYVRYLRLKIDKKYQKKLLHTVRGVGYKFAVN